MLIYQWPRAMAQKTHQVGGRARNTVFFNPLKYMFAWTSKLQASSDL